MLNNMSSQNTALSSDSAIIKTLLRPSVVATVMLCDYISDVLQLSWSSQNLSKITMLPHSGQN
jgi:hypothetical protein